MGVKHGSIKDLLLNRKSKRIVLTSTANGEEVEEIKDKNIEIVKNPCPADGKTKRQFIKNLTYDLKAEIPDVQINLLKSLTNIEQLNIWPKEK